MKKELFKSYSRLAFRSAAITASLLTVAIGLSMFYFEEYLVSNLLITCLLAMIITFCITYTVLHFLHYGRLQKLDVITRDISQKKFDEYEQIRLQGKDELDYIIRQTIRASKTTEREILRLNRIENYRKEFIGDISHELKTPIFAIQGFIKTLLDGALNDDQVNRKFLEKAMRNVDRLTYLTEDLMEISKLETGQLKSDIRNVNLYTTITEVVENLQYKARKENVTLTINYMKDNIQVRADKNQLKQTLINLIENAIKYNKADGSVTVGAESWTKDKSRMRVYVKDTGIGMEQQYIKRVTERFFRIDKSRSREQGGTGLGLAIVKHIMEAHDEEFIIESIPDVGSTFSFTLRKTQYEMPNE